MDLKLGVSVEALGVDYEFEGLEALCKQQR